MTTWFPTSHEDYEQLKGFEVFTSDDEKLGKIAEVYHPNEDMPQARGSHYFLVDPGALKKLFTDQGEVFVAESMIRRVDDKDDKIILEIPKSQVEKTNWGRPTNYATYRRG
jgi:ribosomal 30S subunit maturation factor RimM